MTRWAWLWMWGLVGCVGQSQVEQEVREVLRFMEQAERDLDSDKILSLLSPEFSMFADGHRVDHDTTVQQIQSTMPLLQSFHASFQDIEVIVLGPNTAVSSMKFHDVITNAEGEVSTMWGPSTMVWRKEDEQWKMLFADSDHYPVTAESSPTDS